MIIVMQGRVRSERLPGKGFFTFFGDTIWERMCEIARAVRGVDEVILATGDLPENRLIQPLVEGRGVRFHVGSERNVLERFCTAIEGTGADYVVRLTCDNYLAQPDVIEGLADAVRTVDADYGYVEPLSHFGGEVIRVTVLSNLWHSGRYSREAEEHVTWDIRNSAHINVVALPANFLGLDHAHSLTLDTIDDLILMKSLEQRSAALRPVRCLAALRELTA